MRLLSACEDPNALRALWEELFYPPRRTEEFPPGTQLRCDRGVYDHHGLFLGDGWVIHYSGEPLNVEDARVRIDKLESFADGDRPLPVDSPISFPPEEVCVRALSRYGENRYKLFSENCEHFARWCRCGEAVSEQVENAKTGLGVAASALALGGLIGFAAGGSPFETDLFSETKVDTDTVVGVAPSRTFPTMQSKRTGGTEST